MRYHLARKAGPWKEGGQPDMAQTLCGIVMHESRIFWYTNDQDDWRRYCCKSCHRAGMRGHGYHRRHRNAL